MRTEYCCKKLKAALTKGYSWARQICEGTDGDLYIFTYAEDQGGNMSREEKMQVDFCPFCGKRIKEADIDRIVNELCGVIVNKQLNLDEFAVYLKKALLSVRKE